MEDGGTSLGISAIFEISIIVLTFLLITAAILYVPNEENLKNKAISTEISHTMNLISDTDIIFKTNYPEKIIKIESNKIIVENKNNEYTNKKEIYGNNYGINLLNSNQYCLFGNIQCMNHTLQTNTKTP